MRHLLTFCQFVARRFRKWTGKDVRVTFKPRKGKQIGICIRYQCRPPHRGSIYEIRLNPLQLELIREEFLEDIVLHECLHSIHKGHGRAFKRGCLKMGIHKYFHGAQVPKGANLYIKGVREKRRVKK